MQNVHPPSPRTPEIAQLYQQFKTLKDYIDSNKKFQIQIESIPDRPQLSDSQLITPVLLVTPQRKKTSRECKLSTNENKPLTNAKLSQHQAESSAHSHHSHQQRESMIDEYYQHYQYSIKKVLECKQKSAKRPSKHAQEQQYKTKEPSHDAIKKLLFNDHKENTTDAKINQRNIDLSLFQQVFEQSLTRMIASFENRFQIQLIHNQQKLDQLTSNLKKIKTLIQPKGHFEEMTHYRTRQQSVDINEFNEVTSQKDNESICSQNLQHRIEDF